MKVNQALWDSVRKSIESYTDQDERITDITIKCRIKEVSKERNYLQINTTI
tara:strand:+ start:76 stop:228 length:153 start_codon:yes stop_codon:yes gene_type:complete